MWENGHVEDRDWPFTQIITDTYHPGSQDTENFIFTGPSTLTWLPTLTWWPLPTPTASTSAVVHSIPSVAKLLPAVFLVFFLE